jgi:hypothetical protein
MRTIDKIITKVKSRYGAPMGRMNVGVRPTTIVGEDKDGKYIVKDAERVYDCAVPMSGDGAYDKGGAYWGIGPQLRVRYTKDLSFVEFYRRGE